MIELSTKYAIKALINLARRFDEGFVSVLDLAKEIDVPAPYLSKIVKLLVKKDLMDAKRGAMGGVRAIKDKKCISFYDVCLALEDPAVTMRCFFSKNPCNSKVPCSKHAEWNKTQSVVHSFLRRSKIE